MRGLPIAFSDQYELDGVTRAIDEVEAALAPQRNVITRAMLGHEALHAVTKQESAEVLARAEVDIKFFQSFASTILPKMHEKSFHSSPNEYIQSLFFSPKGYQQANLVQALSVWGDFPTTLNKSTSFNHVPREIIQKGVPVPAFMIGAKAVEKSDVQLLLAVPARLTHSLLIDGGFRYSENSLMVNPNIVTSRVRLRDFRTLEDKSVQRKTRYVNNAATADELPSDLRISVEGGVWPNKFSDPVKLRSKRFDAGIKTHNIYSVTAAAIGDTRIPEHERVDVARFDYPKRMLDLAIEFDKVDDFKTLLDQRRESLANIAG
jgi:hypothetical protein